MNKEIFDRIAEKLDQVYQQAFQKNELSTINLIVEIDDLVDILKTEAIHKGLIKENN